MVVADFVLAGSSGVGAAVAVLSAAAALAAAVASTSSWSGSTVVVDLNVLSLALLEADGVHVSLGVVLGERSRVSRRDV